MGSPPTPHPPLAEHPIENHRPLRIRVIGAGFSGVYLGIRIPQRLRNVDLAIYDKNEAIGGTWWENRYPGCACDIPAHSYQYSFAPNLDPGWSGFYAGAAEICGYIQGVAARYGVERWVRLRRRVVRCAWDAARRKWLMTVERTDTGETFADEADVLVSARGSLNTYKWPDVEGLRDFGGVKMHSAAWNHEYDFRNKRIGIIGAGSSAIQIVPQLQQVEGAQLTVFIRSKVWISNRFGDKTMNDLGFDPSHLSFTDQEKQDFRAHPARYRAFRKKVDDDGNRAHLGTLRDSPAAQQATRVFAAAARARLAPHKPELIPTFTPPFAVGCRRVTPGPGFLEALAAPNVDVVAGARALRVTATGVEHSSASADSTQQRPLDVLVCATGFDTSMVPPFPVLGRGARPLRSPETYLSLCAADFPNFFTMLGPNSALGAGSLTILMEAQGDFVVRCARKLQREGYASMAPRPEAVRDFVAYADAYFARTVYTDDCASWYKDAQGRVRALWPGSVLHALEALRAPRWEDFEYERLEDGSANRFAWFGNGFSECLRDGADPSWYLNEEWIEYPKEGRPEDDDKYRTRCFT